MVTITEDYVSFETAKLLKEKGFNEPCYACYLNKELSHYDYASTNFELIEDVISAPTIQMAIKWLREVHDIDISIVPLRSHKEYLPRIESYIISHDAMPCKKYEETAEVAIKYCLENLI